MNYLGHESDASSDHRLEDVIERYGMEGYGLYWYLVERITKELDPPKGIDCILVDKLERVAKKSQMKLSKLVEILDFFVEIGAFQKTSDGQYQNLKILLRLDRYCKQKLKRKGLNIDYDHVSTESMLQILKQSYSLPKDGSALAPSKLLDGANLAPSVSSYAPKGKERKVNEKKVNISVGGGLKDQKDKGSATKDSKTKTNDILEYI